MSQQTMERRICQIIAEYNKESIESTIDEILHSTTEKDFSVSENKIRTDSTAVLDMAVYPIIRTLIEYFNHDQIREALDNFVDNTAKLHSQNQKIELNIFFDNELKDSQNTISEVA